MENGGKTMENCGTPMENPWKTVEESIILVTYEFESMQNQVTNVAIARSSMLLLDDPNFVESCVLHIYIYIFAMEGREKPG